MVYENSKSNFASFKKYTKDQGVIQQLHGLLKRLKTVKTDTDYPGSYKMSRKLKTVKLF